MKWSLEQYLTTRAKLTPYNESPGLAIGLDDTDVSVRGGVGAFGLTDRVL